MDIEEKLEFLGGYSALYDVEGCPDVDKAYLRRRAAKGAGIFYASLGGNRCMPLLRVLQTNVCENDCRYCSINCHRQVRRTSFKPEELAKTFMAMLERRLVRGLFLSSGVAGGATRTAERMLTTVEILRLRMGFRGYIHLKIMPGQSPDYTERAVALADRVSVNLEAATAEHLSRIAPSKDYDLILPSMAEVRRLQQHNPQQLRAGQITQMVVGAAGESDRQVMQATQGLYDRFNMRRVYYSGYQPVCGEVLAPPISDRRQHRLYQADWLLRFYGFRFPELPFDGVGSLPGEVDPKEAWALLHPDLFPIEVNRASYDDLLRVPGIGPVSARRIVGLRGALTFRELKELSRLGTATKRARHYLLLDGRFLGDRARLEHPPSPFSPEPGQLSLWDQPQPLLAPVAA